MTENFKKYEERIKNGYATQLRDLISQGIVFFGSKFVSGAITGVFVDSDSISDLYYEAERYHNMVVEKINSEFDKLANNEETKD